MGNPNLLSAEGLRIFFYFVVPGVVATWMVGLLSPAQKPKFPEALAEAVAFSVLNDILLSWLPTCAGSAFGGHYESFLRRAAFVLTYFVAPALLAMAYVWLRRSKFVGGHLLHPDPTAWDYCFGRQKPGFIIANMKDGSWVGGYYGPGSHVSSYPDVQQLYIEQAWRITEDGKFREPVEGSDGVLLSFSECSHIELFDVPTSNKEETSGGKASAEARRLPAEGAAGGAPTEAARAGEGLPAQSAVNNDASAASGSGLSDSTEANKGTVGGQ